jgi:hypothetical protein
MIGQCALTASHRNVRARVPTGRVWCVRGGQILSSSCLVSHPMRHSSLQCVCVPCTRAQRKVARAHGQSAVLSVARGKVGRCVGTVGWRGQRRVRAAYLARLWVWLRLPCCEQWWVYILADCGLLRYPHTARPAKKMYRKCGHLCVATRCTAVVRCLPHAYRGYTPS